MKLELPINCSKLLKFDNKTVICASTEGELYHWDLKTNKLESRAS